MTATIDLYDFGAPVNVVAPPADKVTDLKDFAKSLGLGGSGAFGDLGGATGGTSGVLGVAPALKTS
jgi:hypothetical protein